MIHSYDYADDDGDYRLDVAVHTDKRGPDPFLSGGIRWPLVRSLQTMMLKPNMAYAMKADRWPVIELFVIYISD